jgi:hypothetical protein
MKLINTQLSHHQFYRKTDEIATAMLNDPQNNRIGAHVIFSMNKNVCEIPSQREIFKILSIEYMLCEHQVTEMC